MIKETSSAKSLCHQVLVTQECQSMKKTCCFLLPIYLHYIMISSSYHRPSHPIQHNPNLLPTHSPTLSSNSHRYYQVMRKARLPRRENFRKDVYLGYADTDADCQQACVTLPSRLTWHCNMRILLRQEEEIPGCIRAETIVQHMDDSWKVIGY